MGRELTIPAKGFDGLAALAEIGPTALVKLSGLLDSEKLTLDIQSRIGRWAAETGVAEGSLGQAVALALIPLNRERERRGLDAGAFLSSLDQAVQAQANKEWKDLYSAKWAKTLPALEGLFKPNNFIEQAYKAGTLLFERPAVLIDTKVFTEVRPLYTEQVSSIKWLVLSNTLVVEFQQDGRRQEVHLSVDYEDLRTLIREAKRAHEKSRQLIEDARQWGVGVLTFDSFEAENENP